MWWIIGIGAVLTIASIIFGAILLATPLCTESEYDIPPFDEDFQKQLGLKPKPGQGESRFYVEPRKAA